LCVRVAIAGAVVADNEERRGAAVDAYMEMSRGAPRRAETGKAVLDCLSSLVAGLLAATAGLGVGEI
jgi:hypothetical protein